MTAAAKETTSYEVWRTMFMSDGRTFVRAFRWRWLARLYAWEHTRRGWFRYEVRP